MSALPPVIEIREKIESITSEPQRIACKMLYLLAARVSEVVAVNSKYGLKAADVHIGRFGRNKALVFSVKTAKRGGVVRNLALPFRFEPWTEELYAYCRRFKPNASLFPFTRQKLWRGTKPFFANMKYAIDKYHYVDSDGKIKEKESHFRSFTLHALRHLRATELVEFYGFDALQLTAFCGWTISVGTAMFGQKVPSVMSKYLYLNWQSYFPKLLKKR